MHSVLGNHKTMTHQYTVNVIHVYIVFTQQLSKLQTEIKQYLSNIYLHCLCLGIICIFINTNTNTNTNSNNFILDI